MPLLKEKKPLYIPISIRTHNMVNIITNLILLNSNITKKLSFIFTLLFCMCYIHAINLYNICDLDKNDKINLINNNSLQIIII